ncbi:MAG TPA: efflux RND transporter periplasmic adaptor subunit [Bacteroidia bacterium]|nr:efflux RND transporter periplasmic adaptor subunit [Bacteroidia bacterium]
MKFKSIFLLLLLPCLQACTGPVETKRTETVKLETGRIQLTPQQYHLAGIQTVKPEWRNLSSLLRLSGQIDVPPQNMVSVSMPLGGFLKSTSLLPGTHVKKGEVIALMEDQKYIELQKEYLTAKMDLQVAEKEYQRQKELNSSKASSDKIFQQTEREYTNLRISLASLAEKLRLINIVPENLNENTISRTIQIYSPINGYVSKVLANIGKYVNPADVLFELINPDDIHLNLTVFEKDLDKLSIGQSLVAYNNNQPEKKHACEIILIGQNLSAERCTEVHCHFKQYDRSLFPGMYMNAEIGIHSNRVLCVPDKSVLGYKGKDYVFVERGDREFELLEVKKGISESGYTEIKNLDEDLEQLKVVKDGAYQLLMQLKNQTDE